MTAQGPVTSGEQVRLTGPRCPTCGLPTQSQAYGGGREGYCGPCDNNFLIDPPIAVTIEAALVDNAATRGRWSAVMLSVGGRFTSDPGDVAVIRVARAGHSLEGAGYAGDPLPEDVLYEITAFADEAEVGTRWLQAQAVAELFNAVARACSD